MAFSTLLIILDRLKGEINLLTDTIIHYDDVSCHCHSSVVCSLSSVVKEKLFRSSSIEFTPLPFTDPDLFFSVLSTFYGQSLPITTKSLPTLSFIASLLQFEELSDFVNERMTKGLGYCEDNSFQLDLTSLVSKMIKRCQCFLRKHRSYDEFSSFSFKFNILL
ncbi:hypothetical protein GEMRC1_008111 [Eukaryota sp. GEM-RC1]